MSPQLGFVGDIHGNILALRGVWDALMRQDVSHVVFLGDYINKGERSAEVVQELVTHAESGRASLLAGNHETALLRAIDRQDLSGFLKMGGATTIRSYVGGPVGADVLGDFLASIPAEHLQVLRRMPLTYETQMLVAQHSPPKSPMAKFRISAHVPVGLHPRITKHSAELDTGCGYDWGRLTALLWPGLEYIQADCHGHIVTT